MENRLVYNQAWGIWTRNGEVPNAIMAAIDRNMQVTSCLVDRVSQAMTRDYAIRHGHEDYWRDLFIAKRMSWLNWLTETQREWQRETRRPKRARHHDSIAIRERYVRCHE